MKTINKTQQGFTLVELIIVIVILGILAVTAAPRFLNFQGDAKVSVLRGIEGSLRAAVSLVEGKAIIAGQNATPLSCFENNAVRAATAAETGATPASCATGVNVVFGAPAASVAALQAAAALDGGIVVHDNTSGAALTPALTVATGTALLGNNLQDLRDTGATCRVTYTAATSTVRPTIVVQPTCS
jgi:prepilin-type N-terminal cleavage/methylation domain-containing protein